MEQKEIVKQKLSDHIKATYELRTMIENFESAFLAEVKKKEKLQTQVQSLETQLLDLQKGLYAVNEEFAAKKKSLQHELDIKVKEAEVAVAKAAEKTAEANRIMEDAEKKNHLASVNLAAADKLKAEWQNRVERAKALASQM